MTHHDRLSGGGLVLIVEPPAAALLAVAVGTALAVVDETKKVVAVGAETEVTGEPCLQRSLNQDRSSTRSSDGHAGHTAEGLEGSCVNNAERQKHD